MGYSTTIFLSATTDWIQAMAGIIQAIVAIISLITLTVALIGIREQQNSNNLQKEIFLHQIRKDKAETKPDFYVNKTDRSSTRNEVFPFTGSSTLAVVELINMGQLAKNITVGFYKKNVRDFRTSCPDALNGKTISVFVPQFSLHASTGGYLCFEDKFGNHYQSDITIEDIRQNDVLIAYLFTISEPKEIIS